MCSRRPWPRSGSIVSSSGSSITKLVKKANELEVANHEQVKLQEHLLEAQHEAAQSLTLLETLQSTAPVGFGFVDREYRIVRMNETLASANGLPLDEQLGRRVPDVLARRWPDLEPIYRHVLDTGEAVVGREVEGTNPEGQGEVRFWLASYYPVRIEAEVIGIGLIVVDITDLKQAEDFRSVVMENMAEGLYAVDHEGRLIFFNSAASKMLGWTRRGASGQARSRRLPLSATATAARIRPRTANWTRLGSKVGAFATDEDAFTRKDGSIFPVASSAAPLMGGTRVRGAVVCLPRHDGGVRGASSPAAGARCVDLGGTCARGTRRRPVRPLLAADRAAGRRRIRARSSC